MLITTVPLPFAASLLAGIVAVRVMLVTRKVGWPNGLISLFFALLGVQAILTGFRFEYGLGFVALIQPVLAMLICPVAYLAFRSLRGSGTDQIAKSNIFHLLPASAAAVVLWLDINIPVPIDSIVWASFMIYGALILSEIKEGPDTFERFGTDDVQALVTARIATLCLIIIIMIFDIMIFLNFKYWDAKFTQEVVILGSILLIMISAAMLIVPSEFPIPVVIKRFSRSLTTDHIAASEEEQGTFKLLEDLMLNKKPYLDPNINITRIARQLNIPARAVSNSVNRVKIRNFLNSSISSG